MQRILLVTLMVIAASLSGCVSSYATKPAEQIAKDTEVTDTKFDTKVTYKSKEVFEAVSRGLLSDHQRWMLRSWKNKYNGNLSHQLYVRIWYNTGGWRFYRSANLEGGSNPEFSEIDRDAQCTSGGGYTSCSHEETVGVTLTTEFLQAHASKGFAVRLNSKGGYNNVVTVPSNYIKGHLLAIGENKPSS